MIFWIMASDDVPPTMRIPCQPAPVEPEMVKEEKNVEEVAPLCKKRYYGLDDCRCGNCPEKQIKYIIR